MTELLLDDYTTGKTTVLADGEIIFKDIGGNANYTNYNEFNHTFDAGVGYKVVMEIKNDWSIEGEGTSVNDIIYDRLGFRTKETSESTAWVNGNVPWFRQTLQTDMGDDVWGDEPGSMGDGWILPPTLSTLNVAYNYVSASAVNDFIPINYAGNAQIIRWHFFSDSSVVEPGWEIKITRVAISDNAISDNAISDNAGSDNAGSDNAVTCTGNGVYNITNTGSITCI